MVHVRSREPGLSPKVLGTSMNNWASLHASASTGSVMSVIVLFVILQLCVLFGVQERCQAVV
jgi:hypothetical protein